MHIKSLSLTVCIMLLALATSSSTLYADAVFQSQMQRTLDFQVIDIASKKGVGSDKNGRDSNRKRSGVKVNGG